MNVSISPLPADNTHQDTQEHGDPPRKWGECQTTDRTPLCIAKAVSKWLPTAIFPTGTVLPLAQDSLITQKQQLEIHTHFNAEMRLR